MPSYFQSHISINFQKPLKQFQKPPIFQQSHQQFLLKSVILHFQKKRNYLTRSIFTRKNYSIKPISYFKSIHNFTKKFFRLTNYFQNAINFHNKAIQFSQKCHNQFQTIFLKSSAIQKQIKIIKQTKISREIYKEQKSIKKLLKVKQKQKLLPTFNTQKQKIWN
ncbi:hypothetical protein TTHERM_000095441 (macronuclear) [Tetrahymena thermophila SB210]|uniref:Uncharacterized protein n=1 Tax=Tetrahymena thermophila (strain SB210) TaxID=312017 RepID=W7XJB2_TETTS|nr:hypothetical protein TTHERM_000095441 [Tetrahymena thermophila SB210]EWS75366.1 hypothetical protein TTHERM_000095441 [Tetrahymena thermophila SB210]|eukprot:XP_012652040.1 hypothetical protein TTHERM_000095441 [Tetrahymena thermophila SB210]